MANQLANTDMSKKLWQAFADGDWAMPYEDTLMLTIRNAREQRWPHEVHYVGRRVIYTRPDQFCMIAPLSPSDCIWIVPGTTP